jgi:elongation factor G
MDIMGADFYGAVEQIKTKLGKNAIILQIPIGKEDSFAGVIDLLEMKAYTSDDDKGENVSVSDIPPDLLAEAEENRGQMVEKICELDDDLMTVFLEDKEPKIAEMKAALRKATCEGRCIPVCCGSAYRNKGIQKLLDAVIEYLPAPTDIPAIEGEDLDANPIELHSSDEEPFSALVFKIMTDPLVGKLAFVRV